MALHGYVNTTKCACWDVDSYNCAGVYTTADLDNGTFVTLTNINRDSTEFTIKGYEWVVAPATSTSTRVWLVASPEVGTDILMQELADPRQFYNAAGEPMSLKYLVPGVDIIEVTKECFTDTTLPTNTNQYVTIGAGGKLTATSASPAAGTNVYFTFVGYHSIQIGMENVQTALIRIERN